MNIRRLENGDIEQIRKIFEAQGFDYELPELDSNNIIAKKVVTDENNTARMGVAARITVELYGFVDHTWDTPAVRFAALKQLHEAMRQELKEKGIEDGHFWCPPQLVKSFGRRMMRLLGWKKPEWTDFWRKV